MNNISSQPHLTGHPGMILMIYFDNSGELLFSVSIDGTMNVWDVISAECENIWNCYVGHINDLKYMDGHLFTAGHDRSVAIIDALNGLEFMRLKGHAKGVHSVSILNEIVASGSADTKIGLWDRTS